MLKQVKRKNSVISLPVSLELITISLYPEFSLHIAAYLITQLERFLVILKPSHHILQLTQAAAYLGDSSSELDILQDKFEPIYNSLGQIHINDFTQRVLSGSSCHGHFPVILTVQVVLLILDIIYPILKILL